MRRPFPTYSWAAIDRFIDRETYLARLEDWWNAERAQPLNVYGRRRVGKTWLLQRLAHGKPAVILVASRTAPGPLLARFAAQLEPFLGFPPELKDVPYLFRVLFRTAESPMLAVIDEFPALLRGDDDALLSEIQAVIEEESDGSQLKLVLCGSSVDQMEKLEAERSALRGRLTAMHVAPLSFPEARHFLPGLDVDDQLVRYSVAGGSPLYLNAVASGPLDDAIAERIVNPLSGLFNEPRVLLSTELREPAIYFSILTVLAQKPQDISEIGRALRMENRQLSPYLEKLITLRLVSRRTPAGTGRLVRAGQFRCEDGFLRFWFRFVEPYQSDLEGGADPLAHTREIIIPQLADHTAPVFEEMLRRWIRQKWGGKAPQVAAWWGGGRPRTAGGSASGEEIDAVGLDHKNVRVVGEAKWTTKKPAAELVDDLLVYKLPALAQAGLTIQPRPEIVVASRSGFAKGLVDRASSGPGIQLIAAEQLLTELE